MYKAAESSGNEWKAGQMKVSTSIQVQKSAELIIVIV